MMGDDELSATPLSSSLVTYVLIRRPPPTKVEGFW